MSILEADSWKLETKKHFIEKLKSYNAEAEAVEKSTWEEIVCLQLRVHYDSICTGATLSIWSDALHMLDMQASDILDTLSDILDTLLEITEEECIANRQRFYSLYAALLAEHWGLGDV